MLHLLGPEIDYLALMGELRDYKSKRDKISRLVRDGDLVRVRKGLYVLGEKYEKPYSKLLLANLIYGPSYLCGLSALSFYGAIPEEVKVISSKTLGKSKTFDTPVGFFVYKKIPLIRYFCGLSFAELSQNRRILISSPEKALLEELILEKGITNVSDIGMWVSSHRIDEEFLESLSILALTKLRPYFNFCQTRYLIKWLQREQ